MGGGEPANCRRKVEALVDCQRRHPQEPFLCNHLNNAAALCLVFFICPSQLEEVQTYCASVGTAPKRKLCAQAQAGLDACMLAHQHPNTERIS